MSFHESAPKSIQNKLDLFSQEPARFAVRAMLAGVFLGIMTAFAANTATAAESMVPGLGRYAFASIFATTLYVIVVLQGELATGDMMFMTYGAIHKKNTLRRGFAIVCFVTLFNLIGGVLITSMIASTTIGEAVTTDSFIYQLMVAKLEKPSGKLLIEAILANIVVNIAFMLTTQADKDYTAKLLGVIVIVPAFAAMSYEHSIANFVLTSLTGFEFGPENIPGYTFANVARHWSIVWVGNFIGGGLIMGGIYGWLNLTKTNYKD
ncbi:formate/nitrite transporter family protein [Corynebacterium sp. Marseille-P4321]|uniref:formate/nitrite transporter family protein n=1 Tax=Corynebacterium sp. Marseille-P4321 TaxID=2736603 RepID=UPI00158EB6EB|nr:formate/nitrite transporter family protein [Corynebacterium sp. Marseille-P4321]